MDPLTQVLGKNTYKEHYLVQDSLHILSTFFIEIFLSVSTHCEYSFIRSSLLMMSPTFDFPILYSLERIEFDSLFKSFNEFYFMFD